MKPVGHKMILASAGSGKTYALTNRFVWLLARGARPERIAALTFTRKAAGEFFDEILKKLADAAASPGGAAKIAGQIGMPELTVRDFGKMLRDVIDAMPRLSLGTLDGFFARIVRAFPLELGLGGDFEILQEHGARLERRRVLQRMFAREGGVSAAAQEDFIEAFKLATFGAEEKQLSSRLDSFLDDHAAVFFSAPAAAQWGDAGRIWPDRNPWLGVKVDPSKAAESLRAWVETAGLRDKQRDRWLDFITAVSTWRAGAKMPGKLSYILSRALAEWPAFMAGKAVLSFDKQKQTLTAPAAAALADLVRWVVSQELDRRLKMTRGIHEVLHRYEDVYDVAVRRAGRLTFFDLQRLLQPGAPGGAPPLSRLAAAEEARLFIDFRLDAQIDHWLLDEFQDTSFGQWSVLRNLIDEAVQDASRERSFFYVGDVKQAIFAWRGGDVRLFREIFRHYNSAQPDTIVEERLDLSYRSGPAVIAMVNRVFSDEAALRRLFPPAAAQRWSDEWVKHESAHTEIGGYAQLRHAADETARFAETLRIIEETQPLARGLSVAVLVKRNVTVIKLAEHLRREGHLAAVAESDLAVGMDNPLTSALLALCRAAAHPGDTAAWEQLRMTPVGAELAALELDTPDALTLRVLADIHSAGFESLVESWLRRLEPRLAADDLFSRERGRQFAAAARLFDETGSREVAEFVNFMEYYSERDSDTAGVVHVMTVHKAKGLGFDMVILPDLEGNSLAKRPEGLVVQTAANRTVDWVIDLPAKDFSAHDPVLAPYVEAAQADKCYENFCVLYVAMTRAKQALYLVTEPVGDSESLNFPRLLQETLGEVWSEGDPEWFKKREPKPAALPPAPAPAVFQSARAVPPLPNPRRRPSEQKTGTVPARNVFALEGGRAADFGTEVHRLLAQVEWAGPEQLEKWTAAWAPLGEPAREALAALSAPELAGVWARPSATAEVWRERAFEVVLDGSWVTGTFDRVVLERNAAGRLSRATVFDFKTDRIGATDARPAAARYAGQLGLYRQVAARLTGLAPEEIAGEVVFTSPPRRSAV